LTTQPGTYRTVKAPATAVHRVLGSRHIALVYPVTTEDAIREILDALRSEHHQASHVCYAWRLGWEKKHFRHSDDGEPSGTAGRPIFGQIQSHDLTNVLIVVVRYFGGTKLGTGGLMDAYRTAASMALTEADIIDAEATVHMILSFPYELMPLVMKKVKEYTTEKVKTETGEVCRISLDVALRAIPTFRELEDSGVNLSEDNPL